jgi:hypothetical protein
MQTYVHIYVRKVFDDIYKNTNTTWCCSTTEQGDPANAPTAKSLCFEHRRVGVLHSLLCTVLGVQYKKPPNIIQILATIGSSIPVQFGASHSDYYGSMCSTVPITRR